MAISNPVPQTATLAYNGYVWDVMSFTKITGKPVMDTARRTVKHVEYSVEVDGIVHNDGSATDDVVLDLRNALTAAGGELLYIDKGFGELRVNAEAGNTAYDTEYGPIPEIVSYDPLGNNLGARVHWRCTTRIPQCTDPSYRRLPMDFWYTVQYQIDGDGYTTAVVNGAITIPMTRKASGSRTPPDDVDRLRNSVTAATPLGFKRQMQNWSLSADKRTLTFSYTDEELPVALPPGVTRANIRHSIGSSFDGGSAFHVWQGRIGGEITLARGEPKQNALRRFLAIMNTLLRNRQSNAGVQKAVQWNRPFGFGPVDVPTEAKLGTLLLTSFEMDNDLFGRSVSFNVGYRILGCTIENFLPASGMFKRVDSGANAYKDMLKSLEDSSQHERGFAKLRHKPEHDKIIDLCIDALDTDIVIAITDAAPPNDKVDPLKIDPATGVSKETSWLMFFNNLFLHEDAGKAFHIPLGGGNQEKPKPDANKFGELNALTVAGGVMAAASIEGVVQQVHSPTYLVEMSGGAVRVAHKITPPEVKTIAGVKPELVSRKFRQGEINKIGPVPIYDAKWKLIYRVVKKPTDAELSAPANPEDAVST